MASYKPIDIKTLSYSSQVLIRKTKEAAVVLKTSFKKQL